MTILHKVKEVRVNVMIQQVFNRLVKHGFALPTEINGVVEAQNKVTWAYERGCTHNRMSMCVISCQMCRCEQAVCQIQSTEWTEPFHIE